MKKTILNSFYMLKYIYKFSKFYVIASIIVSALSAVLPIFNLLLLRFILNSTGNFTKATNLAVLLVIYFLISAIINFSYAYFDHRISPLSLQNFQKEMYSLIFEKAQNIELEKYDDPEFYNNFIMALQNSSSRAISVFQTYMTLFSVILSIIGLMSIIFTLDGIMLLLVLTNVLLCLITTTIESKLNYTLSREMVKAKRKMNYVERVFFLKEFAKELRTTDVYKSIFKLYSKSNDEACGLINYYGKRKLILNFLRSTIQSSYSVGIMFYLSIKLFQNTMVAGDFVTIFNGCNQLSSKLSGLMNTIPDLHQHSLFIEKFRDFMEYEDMSDRKKNEGISLGNFTSLEYKNVDFYYSHAADKHILSNLNFKINSGEKIAIVGANGAGKSTVMKLALGLYYSENVYFNDKPISQYDKHSFINSIGVVFQDFSMYAMSIAENVLMRPIDDLAADTLSIREALEKVNLLEKIDSLPNGIFTPLTRELDEEGAVFSGGELQKIAIARVLVRKYEILIMDEPSSALDNISEAKMFDLLKKEYSDKSIIIISHRLSNLKNLDKIYFLDNGQIVEKGAHKELINLNGKYAEMYNSKF